VIEVEGQVVGWVDHDGAEHHDWLTEGQCNLGYHVFAPHRRRGIATRAVELLLGVLRQEGRLREATFLIDADNTASLAVASGAGALERWRRVEPDGRVNVFLTVPIESSARARLTAMASVTIEQPEDGVTVITLDRPAKLNAMDVGLISELHDALDGIATDRACRAVILTGAGRGFCAGLDLGGYGTPPGGEGVGRVQAGMATQKHIAALVPKLRALPQPVIAAVNGPAAGGGLALALASDIRIASTGARFNVAFVRIGLSGCDIGVSWLLPRLIGASRAWELMLTGRIIDAARAEAIGLVSTVVDPDALMDTAMTIAGEIRANSPWGVAQTKEVMWSQLEIPSLQAGIDLENRTQILASHTKDMEEAMAAFLEKRPPDFHHR
jgi:enoyl-CoA hydratase